MDWIKLILDFTEGIAWPVVAIYGLYLFRSRFDGILSVLQQKIPFLKSARFPGGKLEFYLPEMRITETDIIETDRIDVGEVELDPPENGTNSSS